MNEITQFKFQMIFFTFFTCVNIFFLKLISSYFKKNQYDRDSYIQKWTLYEPQDF